MSVKSFLNPVLPNLFDSLDYRQFLKEHTAALKRAKRFNLRAFAKKAEIQAPGYLKMVVDGRRNLTAETAKKFCRALELQGKERDYFLTLVTYNQSDEPDLKKAAFDRLISLRPRSEHFLVGKKHGRYFSRHHYVCIREMVALKDFKEDYKAIARRCFPRISPTQAKEAVETLLQLGFIKRDGGGKLVQAEDFIRTRDRDAEEAETYQFHETVLDKARYALGVLPQKDRHYHALTLPLSKKLFEEISSDFIALRDKIVDKMNAELDDAEEVYQVNFQLFPVTRNEDER